MSLTDPVANYLTLIRNALQAKHQKVDIPCSRLLTEMTRILKEEGYIASFKTIDEGSKRFLRIYLRYGPRGERVISGLQRVSRPGCRVYASKRRIPSVLGNLGISILTTPKGVITGNRARREGVGGEVLCYIW
ncbi:MAG: 30S ribosomal protein S8 [Acidobacteriota bacterium]|nr:30S ribosomal protein S8 [Acidobacteriota bacterium]MDE2964215.1 30S ribosomal protein S8 [Acidobacteriota bacterium]